MRDKAVESACVVIGLMQGGQQEVRGFSHGQSIGRLTTQCSLCSSSAPRKACDYITCVFCVSLPSVSATG